MISDRKPWEILRHRLREDGFIDLLKPDGSLIVTFKPPPDGMTREEFIAALGHIAQVAETERFGSS